MSLFETYVRLGFLHIADRQAYDHLVFIVALCAVYRPGQWHLVAILVTAFTVGHSATLALATLGSVSVSPDLVEFLIPLTILVTAIANVAWPPAGRAQGWRAGWTYAFPAAFGLIHGLGFSSYLRALLGRESSLVWPLFAFNVGIEIGQLAIVVGVLAVSWAAQSVARVPPRAWNVILSGVAAGISITLLARTNPW
jgi:hypothetical protein